MAVAISAQGLQKRLGKKQVLNDLHISADEGSVVGLLGPNGAGKTTSVRILATLLRPDAGRIEICGIDALARPGMVRGIIGLTGQFAAVDPVLTGMENLTLVARLYRIGAREAKRRSVEALERFGLTEVAKDQVKTYSGGMRRRLDLAASVLMRPRVLFLDEPTTGLDLESRHALWEEIEGLVRDGTTVLLTTQYLDEADRLAGTITVLDHGDTVAQGTPDEIKARVGGDRVEFLIADPSEIERAASVIRDGHTPDLTTDRARAQLTVQLRGDAAAAGQMLMGLREAGIDVLSHMVRRPTLDDAFLALTGSRIPSNGTGAAVSGTNQTPASKGTGR